MVRMSWLRVPLVRIHVVQDSRGVRVGYLLLVVSFQKPLCLFCGIICAASAMHVLLKTNA